MLAITQQHIYVIGLGVAGNVGHCLARNLANILHPVWPQGTAIFAFHTKVNLNQGIDPKILDQPGDARLDVIDRLVAAQIKNITADIMNGVVQTGHSAVQLRARAPWFIFGGVAHVLQDQTGRIDGLNDTVVQLTANTLAVCRQGLRTFHFFNPIVRLYLKDLERLQDRKGKHQANQ